MSPDFKSQQKTSVTVVGLRTSSIGVPLGVLALWAGIIIAARRYPSEYDWRYMTLSSLLSPGRNPSGHLWASGGIVLCGLGGLWWSAALARRWERAGGRRQPRGIWFLGLGSVFMACSATLPDWLLRIPKGHEILALLAFVGLGIGTVELTFATIRSAFLRRTHSSVPSPRWLAAVVALPIVFPILLAGFAQAYVFYVLPELHWVNLSWRARGVPVYLSFAFWEWIMCVLLSAYLAILPLAINVILPPKTNRTISD